MDGVNLTSFDQILKEVYGSLREQINTEAKTINLFGSGEKFGSPIRDAGGLGFTYAARVSPNFNMGFRPEGTDGVGLAGNVGFKQAKAYLKYFYLPHLFTGQALNLTENNRQAFIQAKLGELKHSVKDAYSHVNQLFVGSQAAGALAIITGGVSITGFTVGTTGGFANALYLRKGMPIDVGPLDGSTPPQQSVIQTIDYTTGVVTVSPAFGTAPTVGMGVWLQGEAPAVLGENRVIDALAQIVSDAGAQNEIDPAVYDVWASYVRDAGGAGLVPGDIQTSMQIVANKSGYTPDVILMSSAQINTLAIQAQTDMRFLTSESRNTGKRAFDLGFRGFNYAGIDILEDKDILPDRFYIGNGSAIAKLENMPLSLATDGAAQWTRVFGGNGIADAVAGMHRWYVQFAILQRNAWGVVKNLDVNTDFYLRAN